MAHVNSVLNQGTLAEGDIITWSGYNSVLASEQSVMPPAEIGIYPLFPDKAASASSMKHAMELTMQGTEFLNLGQTSVLGADQPLFANIKLLQWQYPNTLGEDKLVAMMGANEARHCLFTTGSRSLENLPPTQAALFQHVKRALLQASFYWNQANSVQQEIPDFSEWGWHKDGTGTWQPLWTSLCDASAACDRIMHCSCLKGCMGRCKCNRIGVRCTVLCKRKCGCLNNGDDSQ